MNLREYLTEDGTLKDPQMRIDNKAPKNESINENRKEAAKMLRNLKAKLKKYPDMPADIKAAVQDLIAFYDKEVRTFTHDDVFPKDYGKR